ncbi:54S ribosomal protein L3, partial [Cichlidogyrus casuarinus]
MDRQKAYWVDQNVAAETDSDLTGQNVSFIKSETELEIKDKLQKLSKVEHLNTKWIPNTTQRVGLIGTKIGLYPLWTKKGEKLDCTVIQIPDNHALTYTPPEKIREVMSLKEPRGFWLNNKQVPSWVNHQRWGLQLVGAVTANPSEYSPKWNAIFEKHGLPTKRKVGRFLVSPDAALMPGTCLKMNHFRLGDCVDITART